MVRTFFNKETGVFLAYRFDSYVDVCPAVSLLLYPEGDGRCPDFAPDFPLGRELMRHVNRFPDGTGNAVEANSLRAAVGARRCLTRACRAVP